MSTEAGSDEASGYRPDNQLACRTSAASHELLRWYVFVFTVNDLSGELIDSREGKLEWIPDENVLDLNLWQSDHIFMLWIQDAKFFSAKFEYEGDKMRGYDVVFHS